MVKRILVGTLILFSIALAYGTTDNATSDFAADKDYIVMV